ncbi:MAG: LysR family transcriptional regulator, partial [Proteobacteria bacterium]|nr:LysR family transcriptional regulator [Pseudomonadota bacterium]
MTLEQLRIFVAVAQHLHVTRAADELHLTQSAASAAIAALEARHNVKLFDRVGRRMELTAAGRALLPEARLLLQNARNAETVLDDLTGLRRGTLAIAASQTVLAYWLPERLARFAHAHPAIRLNILGGNTVQTAQAVIDGQAELG